MTWARVSASALWHNVLVMLAYLIAAKVGFSFAFATEQVTAVWPPTGIAIASLYLLGTRVAAGVFLGAFLANALSAAPIITAMAIAFGNVLGPLLGVRLLHRAGFDGRLIRAKDVLLLTFLGAAAAMTLTATNGVLQLLAAGIIALPAFGSVWAIWWAGDAMGVLLVAPVILTFALSRSWTLTRREATERLLALAALVMASGISFFGSVPLAYPVFPLIILAALGFGQRETSLAVLAISAIAVWATVHGTGPFVGTTLDQQLLLLVTFMAIVAITGLLLGAITAERQSAQESLEQARLNLEQRVAERTAALSVANQDLVGVNAVLTRRTAELASKNEEVEAFVYIVSHDLRAPLVNLQGFSQELEIGCTDLTLALRAAALPPHESRKIETLIDENIRTALRYIAASVTKFERLIEALLALSRTGQQRYATEPLNLNEIVQSTLDSLHQSLTECGAEVTVEKLPAIDGDTTAIGQVFGNLISNAVKYRDPKRPLRISIAGKETPRGVELCVRDNGAGIPEEARRRLFQIFQRFHPQLANGDGIGLASVKRIVERHGGSIRADSTVGTGSSFIFSLNRASEVFP